MGLYEGILQCGCVQLTSTLDNPPVTLTIKFCKLHIPRSETKEDGKNKDNQKDPNK